METCPSLNYAPRREDAWGKCRERRDPRILNTDDI